MGEIKSFNNRVKNPNYMFQGVPHSTLNQLEKGNYTRIFWDIFNYLFLPCSNLGIMCTQNNFENRIIVMNC